MLHRELFTSQFTCHNFALTDICHLAIFLLFHNTPTIRLLNYNVSLYFFMLQSALILSCTIVLTAGKNGLHKNITQFFAKRKIQFKKCNFFKIPIKVAFSENPDANQSISSSLVIRWCFAFLPRPLMFFIFYLLIICQKIIKQRRFQVRKAFIIQ